MQKLVKQVSPKEPNEKLIFFYLETDQTSGEHIINYAVMQYWDFYNAEKEARQLIFPGYTACKDFCAWLFAPVHKGYTAIPHNIKG